MITKKYILQFPHEFGIENFCVSLDKKPTLILPLPKIDIHKEHTTNRCVWEPLDMTLLYPVGDTKAPFKLVEWCDFHHVSKEGYSIGHEKNMELIEIDPTGLEIERFTLMGCKLISNEKVTDDLDCNITIQFDKCFLECL